MSNETRLMVTSIVVRMKDRENARPRVYIHPEGESILENFVNRRSRPWAAYTPLMDTLVKALKLDGLTYEWSQYAGCTCPCSPGFIVSNSMREFPCDVWITYKVVPDSQHGYTELDITGRLEALAAIVNWHGVEDLIGEE